MDKARKWGCITAFAVICLLAINFLGRFTGDDTPLLGTVVWDKAEVEEADGTVRPVDVLASQDSWGLDVGDRLRLTLRLPKEGEVPGLYEDVYLSIPPGIGETVISLDGEEYFHYNIQDMGQDQNFQRLQLTLPPPTLRKRSSSSCSRPAAKTSFSSPASPILKAGTPRKPRRRPTIIRRPSPPGPTPWAWCWCAPSSWWGWPPEARTGA